MVLVKNDKNPETTLFNNPGVKLLLVGIPQRFEDSAGSEARGYSAHARLHRQLSSRHHHRQPAAPALRYSSSRMQLDVGPTWQQSDVPAFAKDSGAWLE